VVRTNRDAIAMLEVSQPSNPSVICNRLQKSSQPTQRAYSPNWSSRWTHGSSENG